MPQPVDCPHCERTCGGPAGLAAHIRSMHPEEVKSPGSNGQAGRPAEPMFGGNRTPPAAGDEPSGLRWEDPPGKGGRPTLQQRLDPLMPELRRGGGRWARLLDFEKPTQAHSAQVKAKGIAAYADIQFKAVKFPDDTSALYGRFAGEDES